MGDQIEIRFQAKTGDKAEMTINVEHGDYYLKEASEVYEVDAEWTEYRYVF